MANTNCVKVFLAEKQRTNKRLAKQKNRTII